MENFSNWENFWQEWRNTEVKTEDDLYYQVGKTIEKRPIERDVFDAMTRDITNILSLNDKDVLVELCCGNGLCTYEFRDIVKQVIAVDFSRHLIEAAKQFKSAPNITYNFCDVFSFLSDFNKQWQLQPDKYLMNDSLAYFNKEDLQKIVTSMTQLSPSGFRFLIRGVPNDDRKWNYYDTEERKAKYLQGVANGDVTNDGMGKWWSPKEIQEVCDAVGVKCSMRNQEPPISHYRMDVLITNQ